jgi:HAD superfamily hydrolase (TIGR01662 family)
VERLLGPFEAVETCPHGRDDGCGCRKPAPGMVERACERLGVCTGRCVVIGDIESDVRAGEAAGGGGILVPTPATDPGEVERAPRVAGGLAEAVDLLLSGRW